MATPQVEQRDLSPSVLLFDPNNFRFQDIDDFQFAAEDRFGEETVQRRAFERLKQFGIAELKRSILHNGYVPVERIVVRPYANKTGRFVVVEGNRRLAAVKQILDEHAAGVAMDSQVLKTVEELPVIVIESANSDEIFRTSLMGIRHVSGIKEWGGYQRAKIIADMRDSLGLEPVEIADRLGMSTTEVNRRYRAFRALKQMQLDEEYGMYAKPVMYPIFHEAVSLAAIKSWLKWSDESYIFTDDEARNQFYQLIVPRAIENGVADAKIVTYSQVRQLKDILNVSAAKHLLLDPERTFADALAAAKTDEISKVWTTEVADAISALESLSVGQLKKMQAPDVELLERLSSLIGERLNDYRALAN